MGIRVGINGFGRIGRNFFRAQHALGSDLEIVALNDLGDAKTMAHLLRYDSNLGPFAGEVELADGVLVASGEKMQMLSERDPAALPWAISAWTSFSSRRVSSPIEMARRSTSTRARRRSSSRLPPPIRTSRSCSG